MRTRLVSLEPLAVYEALTEQSIRACPLRINKPAFAGLSVLLGSRVDVVHLIDICTRQKVMLTNT